MGNANAGHGTRLTDFPRPSVAVDTAVLTVHDGQLCVALVSAEGRWRLPGTFVRRGESLADAVRRSLRDKAGINGLSPRQLHVFDTPDRDSRGWVMSVAHVVVVPATSLDGVALELVTEAQGLAFDHDEMVRLAVAQLRADYSEQPDPARLIGDEFTLLELQRVHEAVAGRPLMRDTFRRAMEQRLTPTGTMRHGIVGKPARVFRRRRTYR